MAALAAKLRVPPRAAVTIVGQPASVSLGLPGSVSDEPDGAGVVVAFVTRLAGLETVGEAALRAARRDAVAWIAYPKAGQLGTDLNRDLLRRHDDVCSALRRVLAQGTWAVTAP